MEIRNNYKTPVYRIHESPSDEHVGHEKHKKQLPSRDYKGRKAEADYKNHRDTKHKVDVRA